MRVWERLNRWADEEAQSTRMYHRLSETAALYKAGKTNLWRDPDLRLALDWRRHNQPTKAWAEQHQGGFELAMAFLDRSRDVQEAERIEADIERRWLAGWSYLPFATVTVLFILLQDYIALYNGVFSVIPFVINEIGGSVWKDRLYGATWIPPLLAGAPAAVVYMVLAPYAKERFRRKAIADIHRQTREGVEPGESAATAPAPAAVDVHATVYASFGRRVAAEVVDWAVCIVSIVAVAFLSRNLMSDLIFALGDGTFLLIALLALIMIFWLYHALAWTSRNQATPGMRLAGIFVTDMRGRRLGWRRATGRHFARFLSYYTAGLGFLIQLWNDKRQALHDGLSGTVILRRSPKPLS
jgi:uncharacterized RDD family membrane protein YckC